MFGPAENFSGYDEGYPLAEEIADYADQALAAHGAPYRRITDTWRFEWIGDPKQYELVIQPALQALADPRLQGGPRDDFERALRKRRAGATKDLEDAIVAATRAVESVLKVLHDAHGIEKPSKQELAALFDRLAHKDVGVLPASWRTSCSPLAVHVITWLAMGRARISG